jgi:hypothetical protein
MLELFILISASTTRPVMLYARKVVESLCDTPRQLCFVCSHPYFLIFSTLPLWAADKGSDEETLRNATTVLQAMLASKDVASARYVEHDASNKLHCATLTYFSNTLSICPTFF